MSPKRKRTMNILGFPLPDLEEIKENLSQVIEQVSSVKDIPRTLLSHLTEADRDFREVDKSLRGTRLKKR